MNKLTSVVAAILILLTFNSCEKITGEGPVVTQDRSTNNFSAISSGISADVYFKQDNVYKIEIQAQQNIIDVIETYVVNNELRIKFKDGTIIRSHEPISIRISAPGINSLRLDGSGNIYVLGNLVSDNMNLNISGSGSINVPGLTAATVWANISGSGNISVQAGQVGTSTLKISGSGSIDMLYVDAGNVNTTTSGSGSIKVKASQNLQVNISGSGSVYYRSNPIITTHISGSGSVVHVN